MLTLTLRVDPRAEPINGSLEDLSGREMEFSGWLGFLNVLQELIKDDASAPAGAKSTND